MLVAAMNPCKCGYFGHPSGKCRCKKGEVHKYISRISGPMLDRFEIQVEMAPLTADELTRPYDSEESSDVIRERVLEARDFADRRVTRLSDGRYTRADELSPEESLKYCEMDDKAVEFMKKAYDRLGLSARGYDRMVRLSRTIADMAKSEKTQVLHVSEALQLRSLDKKYWYEN
jgi:magnesium chelatase family protein